MCTGRYRNGSAVCRCMTCQLLHARPSTTNTCSLHTRPHTCNHWRSQRSRGHHSYQRLLLFAIRAWTTVLAPCALGRRWWRRCCAASGCSGCLRCRAAPTSWRPCCRIATGTTRGSTGKRNLVVFTLEVFVVEKSLLHVCIVQVLWVRCYRTATALPKARQASASGIHTQILNKLS
jgi:hypothetical protein